MRVFLDSCVILSRLPREVAFTFARKGLITLVTSPSVAAEVRHVAKRKGLEAEMGAALIDLQLLAGEGVAPEEDHGLWLKDENDRHIVLGARANQADILLTENLRDFPKAVLAPFGIRALSPDQLYCALYDAALLEEFAGEFEGLKRAKLYRLAKRLKQDIKND